MRTRRRLRTPCASRSSLLPQAHRARRTLRSLARAPQAPPPSARPHGASRSAAHDARGCACPQRSRATHRHAAVPRPRAAAHLRRAVPQPAPSHAPRAERGPGGAQPCMRSLVTWSLRPACVRSHFVPACFGASAARVHSASSWAISADLALRVASSASASASELAGSIPHRSTASSGSAPRTIAAAPPATSDSCVAPTARTAQRGPVAGCRSLPALAGGR